MLGCSINKLFSVGAGHSAKGEYQWLSTKNELTQIFVVEWNAKAKTISIRALGEMLNSNLLPRLRFLFISES